MSALDKNDRPEILLLCHRIPYPPDKGDKIRSWRLLLHLSERFRVHLACFVDDPSDFAYAETLERHCDSAALVPLNPLWARARSAAGLVTGEPLTFPYYRDGRMARRVAQLRARPLAAEIAFSSSMAPYLANAVEGRPRLVDLCDADSEKWRQYAQTGRGLMRFVHAREAVRLGEAETAIANWAEASFAITPEEAAVFNARSNIRRKVDWWANGVDAVYFDPDREYESAQPGADVVFVGAMDYRANVDAVCWFVQEVWPLAHRRKPDATFAVIGPRPDRRVRALGAVNGVTVTGRVDDIRPHLAAAKAVIAPMRIARGVQNKVLEAMAMARAVVLTPAAAQGIEAEDDKELLVAESPSAFAEALAGLLDDEAQAAAIGRAARVRVMADYDWSARLSRFGDALKRLGIS